MKKVIDMVPGECSLPDFGPLVFDDASSSIIFCTLLAARKKKEYNIVV